MGYSSKDGLAIANRLSRMIRCETVSYNDLDKIDYRRFDEFKALLEELYPELHKICERSYHGDTGILYRWAGKSNQDVTVLMSHYDVVPCNEALWTRAPFSGEIDGGYVWGRGTLDTKGTLCGIVEAAEALIRDGFIPENDIYFSFSGDEEISGPSAPAIVEYLRSRDIRPALVLDEGGAIVENVFPGVSKPVAVIGTGEKGYLDLRLVMEGKGGHSSAPPAHSLVGSLAKAVVKLESKPFKAELTAPVLEMFKTLGRHSTFIYRLIFANLWLFMPLLKILFTKQGGEMNALIRTTTAITKMEGSKAYNVLPPYAEIGLNLRLMPNDTVASAKKYVEDIIGNPDIKVEVVESREASPLSPTGSDGWQKVKEAIHETWEGVIVSPYLMLAASDSRHFCEISDHVLRFSAMPLSKEERGLIHGNDERIQIENLVATVRFYENLIRKL
ncbi:MAG: M20/M25/M40 family metallo-hydrolase [Clostridia bacterium]|nr:M20/M25/M40 family metallo-hydrolase [Clostridia bacterium]